ncbi:hypothetical protein [Streptomyces sp. NPDC102360]|uniref:hypothetical protein n=1 Tax=Streptomyces sp. NPDC102360 TaxID=3366160 RepID=UPI00381347DD
MQPTRELHEIQLGDWADQDDQQWKDRYAMRTGVKAPRPSAPWACQAPTTGACPSPTSTPSSPSGACNVVRIADWLRTPARAKRGPRFRALCLSTGLT